LSQFGKRIEIFFESLLKIFLDMMERPQITNENFTDYLLPVEKIFSFSTFRKNSAVKSPSLLRRKEGLEFLIRH